MFGGAGRVRSDFVEKNIEFIRQKSRFPQFWTFMPKISNLLEHLKISIMPPKNDWKVIYYIGIYYIYIDSIELGPDHKPLQFL